MTDLTPSNSKNLGERYECATLDWARAEAALAQGPTPQVTYFVGTCRPDGTPHAAGVGAQWSKGRLYFTSNATTRKSRDLAVNPRCTISVRLPGIDLVLEGEAHRETDAATLERIAAGYRTGGWPAEVADDALTAPFSAPSAGPAPWQVYRFTVHSAVGVAGAEPFGATRWFFEH
ncbi:MAG TPA: pyridoxamine 5'-phosphate oxidase family protein [Actinospica sp.]|jgi:hypothetical protein|nr:pyridoxamine 5'-phosphate oxidase family protein [Actinospica sp.]